MCLFPKIHNTDTQFDVRKYKVTMLSNVNIYILGFLSMQTATTTKQQTNGFVTSSHTGVYSYGCSQNSNKLHGQNSFRNRAPGDK